MSLDKKTKRILILNYEFPPLGGGASPVSYELAKLVSAIKGSLDSVCLVKKLKEINV